MILRTVAGLALAVAFAPRLSAAAEQGALPLMLDLAKFHPEKFVTDGKTNPLWQAVAGRQVFDGLPFLIEGRGCLYGTKMGPEKRDGTNTCPDYVGVPIGCKFDELHLLHVTQFADVEGQEIATIRLNYADGARQEFPIRFGGQVRDWHRMLSEEKELLTDPSTRIVWRGPGVERIHSTLRLFKSVLSNTHPDKVVVTMDVVSARHLAAYDLIAATVAGCDPSRALTASPPPEGGDRTFQGTLTVRVTEKGSGQPVAGALVDPILKVDEVNVIGIPFLTSSNGEGVVRYPAKRTARIEVVVEKEGLFTQKGSLKLGDSVSRQLAVKLGPLARIAGVVQDTTGAPLAGVDVGIWPNWGISAKDAATDATGQFVLTWNPSAQESRDFGLWLLAQDRKRNLAILQPLEEGMSNIVLRLEPALTLTGQAKDTKGNPLPKATAEVTLMTDRFGSSLGRPIPVDPEGRFEIKGLPLSGKYYVNVTAKGYGRVNQRVPEEPEARRLDLGQSELAVADQSVSGIVVDADDKPVADATIYSYGEGQPGVNAKTNKKGLFKLDNICAGVVQLRAHKPTGEYGQVAVEAGQTNVTIQLGVRESYETPGAPVTITGQVLDPAGTPAARIQVHLFYGYSESAKQTDEQGRFRISYDPRQSGGQGNAQTMLVASDPKRNLAAALELEEGATNVTLRLESALVIAGRVTDLDGKVITNAQAQASLYLQRSFSSFGAVTRVSADGRFEIKGLPRGRQYSIRASARGYGQEQRNVEVANSDTNRLDMEPFQLLLADLRVSGVVLNDEDKPVVRAHLYCYGGKQPNISTQTDAKGRFTLDKVCPGSLEISANSEGGSYAHVIAEAGDTNVVIRLSSSRVMMRSQPVGVRLKGKPLPGLAPLGLSPEQAPADQALLLVLIDAEQRPSRRALRVVTDQAAALKNKGVAVVAIQAGAMAADAFAAWKQDAALPCPIGCLQGNAEKERLKWGASALPWLILTDKAQRVTAEGFELEELEAKLKAPSN